MPKGYPNAKHPENDLSAIAAVNATMGSQSLPLVEAYDPYTPRAAPLPPPLVPKTVNVKLKRNYRPDGDYRIVGHTKPEIKRKDSAGREVIIQHEEFVPDEPMPAEIAGTGFANKMWAGTVIEVAEVEAKRIVKLEIGSLEFAD